MQTLDFWQWIVYQTKDPQSQYEDTIQSDEDVIISY